MTYLLLWDWLKRYRQWILALLALAVLFSVYLWGRSNGGAIARFHCKQAEDAALSQADAKYRKMEEDYARKASEIQNRYVLADVAAQAHDQTRVADFASGTDKFRVRVVQGRCRADAPKAGPSPSRADGPNAARLQGALGEGTAELDPRVAAELYAIAAKGDEAIRRLTALQEWARAAQGLCGVPLPEVAR